MKILITGAAGFIGSQLAKALCARWRMSPQNREGLRVGGDFGVASDAAEILLIDHFDDGSKFANGKRRYFGSYANILGLRAKVMALDICSNEFVRALNDFAPDLIYHFAAISDTTVYDQNAILRANLNSFYPILEYSNRSGARLVYASSASVYGRTSGLCKVGANEAPINPYAFSKLQMDIAASGANAVGLRFFNVYGFGEFYKDSTASMALQWGLNLLAGRKITLFDDSADAFRDFVYIDDVVDVCLRASGCSAGVYNVGSGKQASFYELASQMASALGCKMQIEWIENPYKANYQYSTLAQLDEELVRSENMRDIAAGCKDYAPKISQIWQQLCENKLKSEFYAHLLERKQ